MTDQPRLTDAARAAIEGAGKPEGEGESDETARTAIVDDGTAPDPAEAESSHPEWSDEYTRGYKRGWNDCCAHIAGLCSFGTNP